MKFVIKSVITVVVLFSGFFYSYSQNKSDELITIEILFEKLYYAKNDSIKEFVNQKIINELKNYLVEEHDLVSDFEEIKNLSLIKSDDDYIFILTWAVQYTQTDLKYFGFIKFFNRNRGQYYVEEFIDNQNIKVGYMNKSISFENWYGALYYKMITKKYKGERHYVLLAWDGNNDFTNKKIIDILYLEDDDTPILGKNIIEKEGQLVSRLVFEYGERVKMNLSYNDKDAYIIWDHLSPAKQDLKGHYEYYGPDLTFDALYFEKGIWKYIPDIEINQ